MLPSRRQCHQQGARIRHQVMRSLQDGAPLSILAHSCLRTCRQLLSQAAPGQPLPGRWVCLERWGPPFWRRPRACWNRWVLVSSNSFSGGPCLELLLGAHQVDLMYLGFCFECSFAPTDVLGSTGCAHCESCLQPAQTTGMPSMCLLC